MRNKSVITMRRCLSIICIIKIRSMKIFFKKRKTTTTTTTKIIKIQFRGLPPFFAACVRLKFIDAKNQKIIIQSEFFFAGMVQFFLKKCEY